MPVPGLVLVMLMVLGSVAVTIVGVCTVAVVDSNTGTRSGVVGGGEFLG